MEVEFELPDEYKEFEYLDAFYFFKSDVEEYYKRKFNGRITSLMVNVSVSYNTKPENQKKIEFSVEGDGTKIIVEYPFNFNFVNSRIPIESAENLIATLRYVFITNLTEKYEKFLSLENKEVDDDNENISNGDN